MRRHCNGRDPNLIRYPDADKLGHNPARDKPERTVPCNCGKVFDDVYYSTIYPHAPI